MAHHKTPYFSKQEQTKIQKIVDESKERKKEMDFKGLSGDKLEFNKPYDDKVLHSDTNLP